MQVTGNECVEWSYADLVQLSIAIAAYVAPKVAIQQAVEIEINACETLEAVEAVVINYDTEITESEEEIEDDILDEVDEENVNNDIEIENTETENIKNSEEASE